MLPSAQMANVNVVNANVNAANALSFANSAIRNKTLNMNM
jgi:hypothetical protein